MTGEPSSRNFDQTEDLPLLASSRIDRDDVKEEPLEMDLDVKSFVIANPDKNWKQKALHYLRRYPRISVAVFAVVTLFAIAVTTMHDRSSSIPRAPRRKGVLTQDFSQMDLNYMNIWPYSIPHVCLFTMQDDAGEEEEACPCVFVPVGGNPRHLPMASTTEA